jgi:ankyrin repeat protein
MYASDNGHVEIVQLLLSHGGIDVNQKNSVRSNYTLFYFSLSGFPLLG